MAGTITITCPHCATTLTAPVAVAGKKVRCKSCGHIFAAQAAAGKPATEQPAPPAKAAPAPAKAAPAPAKPAAGGEDDDQNSDPYAVTDVHLAPRCPYCAEEMPSEDAIICLNCGYNTQTRLRLETKKVFHTSGFDWLLWLGPGILCALFVVGTTVLDILYWINANDWFGENDPWYLYMWRLLFFKLWSGVLTVYLMYLAGRFAIKRLILHPHPPEYEKK
jgi:predicted Zn finger-like uncharacterized protein